jgi:hypothetical protein
MGTSRDVSIPVATFVSEISANAPEQPYVRVDRLDRRPPIMILWLLGLWPHLNLLAAIAGAAGCTFFGLFILVLWVPGYTGTAIERERVEDAYLLFAVALVWLAFGALAFALILLACVVGMGAVVVRSVRIVSSPRTPAPLPTSRRLHRLRYSPEVMREVDLRFAQCETREQKLALASDLGIVDRNGNPSLYELFCLAHRYDVPLSAGWRSSESEM